MIIASIFTDLQTKLSNEAHFTDEGLEPLKAIDWYNGQYQEAVREHGNKGLPFQRPAVFIEFEDLQLTALSMKSSKGEMAFKLHVVVDLIGLDGHKDPGQGFLNSINYHAKVNELIDGVSSAACGKAYRLTAIQPDHDNDGLMVFISRYTVPVVIN